MKLNYDAAGTLVGIDVQHASQRADIHQLAINHMPIKSTGCEISFHEKTTIYDGSLQTWASIAGFAEHEG